MADVSHPSLEEVLSRYGFQKKDLDPMCPREVRDKIALKLEDWKMAGRCLKFGSEKLTAIDRENGTEDQRRVALLDDWAKREGKEATYLKLAEVLHQRERSDLIEMLCSELKKLTVVTVEQQHRPVSMESQNEHIGNSPAAVIDTAERIEILESQFDSLHRRLVAEITNNEVLSAMELLRTLTVLPVSLRKQYESLVQQMLPALEGKNTTPELFLRLNPLFIFIDYGLLNHLISKYGSPTLKGDMESYVSIIKLFMRETTVADLMEFWPGDEPTHLNYSKLKAKFSDDPKSYTLERLDNFRRKFCSKVRLSELIFGLILLESGESFFATWIVPTVVATELTMLLRQIEISFYKEENVLMISLDEEVLYQSNDSVTKNTEEDLNANAPEEIGHHEERDPHESTARTEVGEVTPTDISVKHQKELERLKTALTEKDLENQRLLLAVEEAETVHKPLIQAYAAKISEKVSDFMKFIQDRSGDSSNDELEQMKIEIQELTACLEKATGQIGRRETKTTFVDTKHHFVQRWLNASPSSPPPSDIDSGLITEATSIRSVDSESSDIVDPIRHIYNEFPQQT